MAASPSNKRHFLLFFLIIWLSLISCVKSKIVKGEINTHLDWLFLTRFCFLSLEGRFEYDIEFPKSYMQNLYLLLYYDSHNQWPAIYNKNKTCSQKFQVTSEQHGQRIRLTSSNVHLQFPAGCQPTRNEYNESMVRCISDRRFMSHRERWWFIAISRCNATKQGLKLKYRIRMTNHPSKFWKRHFSADEFDILQTDISFSLLYFILVVLSSFSARMLRARHLLHHTFKLYISSVIFQFGGVVLMAVNYGLFGKDGVGISNVKLSGQAMQSVSTVLFLLLLILIAKGYTVTRGRLRPMTSAKIGVLMTVYCITYSGVFIYELKEFDPGEVLYIYESPPGYILIALRLFGWAWFVYATVFTLIHYPEKSVFYTRLFLIYSIWFLSAPVIVLIATFIVGKWMREKIINGVELAVSLAAHAIFLFMTRPSANNTNFPFHVRTTQIDIMEETVHGILGDNQIDRFCPRSYAPTAQMVGLAAGTSTSFMMGDGHQPTVPNGPGMIIVTEKPPDYTSLFGAVSNYKTNEMETDNKNDHQNESRASEDSGIVDFQDGYAITTSETRNTSTLNSGGNVLAPLSFGAFEDSSTLITSPPHNLMESGYQIINLNK